MESGQEQDTVARHIGRYTLFREVARGGMATVHLGRLRGVGGFARTVAIKRLHPPFARDPEFVSMFLDEARLAARVQHPNVVPVLDVLAAERELFLVMDYVHGESLARLLKRASASEIAVPARIVCAIVIDLLYGLHAAHEALSERGDPLHIVHRDVSPQNVLVGVDGVARVLDFGIAKAAQRIHASTRSGQLKGKLAYMAPEQVGTSQVDRRADVYAAAVVLWEALTGERLFPPLDTGELIAQILTRDHPPPSRYCKELPAGVDEVVTRGLARDPAHRHATAHEMAAELERVASPATPREVGQWVKDIADTALRARAASIAEVEVATLANSPPVRTTKSSFPPAPPAPGSAPVSQNVAVGIADFEELEGAEDAAIDWKPPRRLSHVLAPWVLVGLLAVGMLAAVVHWSGAAPQSAQAAVERITIRPTPAPSTPPSTLGIAANSVSNPDPLRPSSPTPLAAEATAPAPSPGPSTALPRGVRPAALKSDCRPPYTLDAHGVRIPKRWCP
jgi:serine/threonine-protein kinase